MNRVVPDRAWHTAHLVMVSELGNSVASTASAVTQPLTSAILCASSAARGQYGQVGVTKTCGCSGVIR